MAARYPEQELHLEKYWKIIKQRLHVLVYFTLLVIIIMMIKVFSEAPLYQARGVLMVEPENRNVMMFSDRIAISRPDAEYFNTQMRIIQSRTLAQNVIEEIGPRLFPDNFGGLFQREGVSEANMAILVDMFLHELRIETLPETQLLTVSYKAFEPRVAADAVNTLFTKFIEFNQRIKSETTRQASEFIARQISQLKKKLDQKERELQQYSSRKDLFYLTNQESEVMNQFADLNRAFTQAQIERINRESMFKEFQGKRYDDYPEVRNSPLINDLKNNYSTLEAEYQRKSQIYKDTFPEMSQLKSQLGALQDRILKESQDIAHKTYAQARSDYDTAVKKEQSLIGLMDGSKKQIGTNNSNAVYYKSLNIEVANMRELQNFLDKKLHESELSSRLEGLETSNIKVIDKAEVPRKKVSPNKQESLALALLFGLTGGVALIFLMNYLDRTIKNPEEVKMLLDYPTLGIVPSSKTKQSIQGFLYYYPYKGKSDKERVQKDIELINFYDPESAVAESYRNIRTSILFSTPKNPPKVICISSARPSEGKTSTAVNLAISFSQLGKSVLLMDGDLRKPRIHKVFNLKNTVGLSTFLVGRAPLSSIIQKTEIPRLSVITSGPVPPNPVELLDSEIMEPLLKKSLLKEADFIFIDSPPFIDIADPILLSKHANGLVLVAWGGKTNRSAMEKAKEQIDKFNIRIIGVILNKVDFRKERNVYDYAYRYSDLHDERFKSSRFNPSPMNPAAGGGDAVKGRTVPVTHETGK
jgi:polysaccharide biosynthesis transport protein